MIGVGISLVLVAIAFAIARANNLAIEKDLVVAVARAIAQLAVVAAVIQVVFRQLGLSALLLLVMVAAAAWTSGRRLQGVPRAPLLAAGVIAASSGVALLILFGAGVFELEGRFLIPLAGMLIGNSMTAVSLAGNRLRDELVDKRLEIEARLALGIAARDALNVYARRAAVTALIPTIDSTKNVGIIFLPGAFVGMLLAGASPAAAAQVQLIVLFMLLGAVAVAAMAITVLVGRSFLGAGERIVVPSSLA